MLCRYFKEVKEKYSKVEFDDDMFYKIWREFQRERKGEIEMVYFTIN